MLCYVSVRTTVQIPGLQVEKPAVGLGRWFNRQVLSIQAQRPHSVQIPQDPCEKPVMVACSGNPDARMVETGESLGLTGQLVSPNW